MERFKQTTEGYLAAKKWLQGKNVWDRVIQSDLTANTQSVIEIANALLEKLEKNKLVVVDSGSVTIGDVSPSTKLTIGSTTSSKNLFVGTTAGSRNLCIGSTNLAIGGRVLSGEKYDEI